MDRQEYPNQPLERMCGNCSWWDGVPSGNAAEPVSARCLMPLPYWVREGLQPMKRGARPMQHYGARCEAFGMRRPAVAPVNEPRGY